MYLHQSNVLKVSIVWIFERALHSSSQAKEAAKTLKATLKRRDTAERFLSLPGFTDHGIPEICKYILHCCHI